MTQLAIWGHSCFHFLRQKRRTRLRPLQFTPTAWLSEEYGDDLGVLWIEAHADVTTATHYPHAHAYFLGLLLG
jgi:hypothetical protein